MIYESDGPLFFLQIVDREGKVAHLPGGGELEVNLINTFTSHIVSKGVGFFKTEAQVRQAIQDGIKDAIMAMKKQTIFLS